MLYNDFVQIKNQFPYIIRRAYKPANQYMDFFVSPLAAVTARFITFIAGSILGVLLLLSGKSKNLKLIERVITNTLGHENK